jgi:hypothetical protein
MFSREHHTSIFIISKCMLLLLKDLLAKLIITCTLKDKLITWLCLIEVYLASLGRRIQTRKLVFKTQVMAKGFKTRVSEF